MNNQILEDIGLTKTEIKIYIALLKLGQSTTTNIIRESQVPASKVYEFLDKLIQKGLVSYVVKSNKKYFTASEPNSLKSYLNEKKKTINEQERNIDLIIPELKLLSNTEKESIKSEVYEGVNGIKTVYEKILGNLNKGETQYIIGAPKVGNELVEGYLLDWHKRRIKKGIKCNYIYDSNAKEYGKLRERMPNSEVKYLPKGIISPMWIEIFGDYVLIGHIKHKEFSAVLFLIKDREIAKGYLDYFELFWKIAKR